MPDDMAESKADLRHVEGDGGKFGGHGLTFDDGTRRRHFMNDAIGIDASKDDAAFDMGGYATEEAAVRHFFVSVPFWRIFNML